MEFLKAGFDVLCSDLDVIWLGDPRPWIHGEMPQNELLAFADVIVSTDVTGARAHTQLTATPTLANEMACTR